MNLCELHARLLNEYLARSKLSSAQLARQLGISVCLLYQYRSKRRPVPIPLCPLIEQKTNGSLTRRDLRPYDWHRIWPELAAAHAKDAQPETSNATNPTQ